MYLSNIIANTSHSAVCIFSFYNFAAPDCDEPYPFKWFVDDICFLSVDVKFGCACSMLIGYLVFDFIYATLYVQQTDEMTYQMHFHHIMAIISTMTGLLAGYALNGIANMLLMMEFSTVALNYRNLYEKEEYGDTIPRILQAMVFLKFLFFRVLLMPYAYYLLIRMIILVWNDMPAWRQAMTVLAAILFGGLALLNYWWFSKMVQRAIKVLSGEQMPGESKIVKDTELEMETSPERVDDTE